MSRLDCERWASLLDREALEGNLSRDEMAFQADHAGACEQCARELAGWRELRTLNPIQASALDRDAALEEVVLEQLWREAPVEQRRVSRLRPAWLAAGALLAAAAALLLFFASQRQKPAALEASLAHVTIASGRALHQAGGSQRVAEAVTVGSQLRATDEPLCLLIESAVRACLSPGGELRVADLDMAHRRIELLRGRLVSSLDPQPAGSTFSVSAAGATVTAVGTIFTVEVGSEAEQVLVRVARGSVKVRSSAQPERLLHAHQSLAFGAQVAGDVSPAQEASDLGLLRLDSPGVVAPDASAAASASAPTSADSAAAARPAVSIAPVASEAAGPSALLGEALALRRASRFSDAAQVYRRLVTQHPGSAEARAAWLSLGDLQLSRLNDPAAALRSFDAYVKSGDRGLLQEAEYGRIRALRALGNERDEALAIERLLTRYPSGVHAESMRARLRHLKGDAP